MKNFKLGYAKVCITPPMGVELAGYGAIRAATSVHDDLFARVIVLEACGEDFVFVQCDLLGLDYAFTDKVKTQAQEKFAINPKNISVGTTHTHSGPKGLLQDVEGLSEINANFRGRYNEELCNSYFEAINNAIDAALSNKCDGTMRPGQIEAHGIATNRNDKEKTGDTNLTAIEFIRTDGKKVLLYNFGCHPTVMHAENTAVTADWPYGVAKLAEGSEYEMTVFFNGSAGDVSTRFTREAPTFENMERLGAMCHDYIKKALDSAKADEIVNIKVDAFTHKIKLKKIDSIPAAIQKLEHYKKALDESAARGESNIRAFQSKVEGATLNLAMSESLADAGEYNELRVQLVSLNDFVFVFVPCELFSALTNPLKALMGKNILFVTYSNGYMGYVCDKSAYDAETYEALSSPFERGEGELFIEAIAERLRSI